MTATAIFQEVGYESSGIHRLEVHVRDVEQMERVRRRCVEEGLIDEDDPPQARGHQVLHLVSREPPPYIASNPLRFSNRPVSLVEAGRFRCWRVTSETLGYRADPRREEPEMSKDYPDEDPTTEPGAGSGRGGGMGTPDATKPVKLPPPSMDQEENVVISGGGVADGADDGHR